MTNKEYLESKPDVIVSARSAVLKGRFNSNEVSRKFVAVKDFVTYTIQMLIESGKELAVKFYERNATFVGKVIGVKIGDYDGFKPEWYQRILDTNPAMRAKYEECIGGLFVLQEMLEGVNFPKGDLTFSERQMVLRAWMRNHRDAAEKISIVAPEAACLYSF